MQFPVIKLTVKVLWMTITNVIRLSGTKENSSDDSVSRLQVSTINGQ